jgi:uncharacterized protein DUF1707
MASLCDVGNQPDDRTALGSDVRDIATSVGAAWTAHIQRRATRERATRDAMLASDADRDTAVQLLTVAFSDGRLTSSELEDRTGRTLAARTHGELDAVLRDLGGLQRPVRSHPVRTAVFWLVAVLFSPFVLLGGFALAFGVDAGDRSGGVFFLLLTLPALFALRRWAWPRS